MSVWALFSLVVLAALVALVSRKKPPDPQDPAAIAESACLLLKERMDSSVALPPESILSGSAPLPLPADSSAGLAGESGGPRPLRDLFAPGKRLGPDPGGPAPARREPRAAVPTLSGIFIDGGRRQAAIGGKLAGPGEPVDGYIVVEIGPDYVVLERNGTRQTVGLGRNP